MSDIEMPAIDYMGTIAMQSRIIEQLEAANRLNAAQVAALRTRIEQLEAALREIAGSKTRTAMALRSAARAALGEKE